MAKVRRHHSYDYYITLYYITLYIFYIILWLHLTNSPSTLILLARFEDASGMLYRTIARECILSTNSLEAELWTFQPPDEHSSLADLLISALTKIQLSCVWTPDPHTLWDNKGVLFEASTLGELFSWAQKRNIVVHSSNAEHLLFQLTPGALFQGPFLSIVSVTNESVEVKIWALLPPVLAASATHVRIL